MTTPTNPRSTSLPSPSTVIVTITEIEDMLYDDTQIKRLLVKGESINIAQLAYKIHILDPFTSDLHEIANTQSAIATVLYEDPSIKRLLVKGTSVNLDSMAKRLTETKIDDLRIKRKYSCSPLQTPEKQGTSKETGISDAENQNLASSLSNSITPLVRQAKRTSNWTLNTLPCKKSKITFGNSSWVSYYEC
ncbi:uncharacterized protein I206_105563 [Kwoniella pini CBS 10737]|uniref:Uncharacterized protein n=1 Tax=Kwoniella pini CBS 10737 TaxID=1296096 RepID=A0A1B9I3W9_9TREE|nr:uncharacterized protein I206_03534 [Kwoniella pini CBS 10737]OCF50215.1 hypothetical protein I206_03534 [Kwoniella pini CBS 10737]